MKTEKMYQGIRATSNKFSGIRIFRQPISIVLLVLLAGCLIMGLSICSKDLSGEYVLEYIQPGHPYGNPFGAKIQVLQISPKQAFVEVDIDAPTAFATSSGHLFGRARISGNQLYLTCGDGPHRCEMNIEIKGSLASIISIENCSGYHGAGCNFSCGTSEMKRIGPPNFSEIVFSD